jgi:hypothetical protein
MGIEDDKIDQIIDAHSETVNALKDVNSEYKEKADKYESTKKELDKLKQDIKDAEEKNGKDPYKVKYEALKEDYEEYKKQVTAKETKANKEKLYTELLKEAGVNEKRIASVLRVSDLDKVEIDENGKLKDSADLTKSIKEEWADFITTTETKGAKVSNPPAGGSVKTLTKDEIMKIKDTGERQKAIAENHELFGF